MTAVMFCEERTSKYLEAARSTSGFSSEQSDGKKLLTLMSYKKKKKKKLIMPFSLLVVVQCSSANSTA